MSLTVQNLRAVGTGVEPASLLPGQLCFNITDKVLYVGDGSSFKTSFDGTQAPGTPGEGWYAMPMDFASLGDYYVANPEVYGDTPTDQQVLTWSTALNHPIWTTGSGAGGNQVYVVTNAQVASASGATTSDKITSAIGVASPDEGDVTIVTGLPDDVYEGLYFFTTSWVKGAAYAYPSASEVIYNNTGRTIGATVQAAIDDLDDGLIATTAIANTANSTATSALSIASAALPRSGGTMTGVLTSVNINVQSGHSIAFAGGVNGNLDGITDSTSLISSTVAASATAVKNAYDLANGALSRTGGTMSGLITFAVGQTFPISGIQIASTSQLGVVQVGTNINVTGGGTISVNSATTSTPGVVQLTDSTTTTSSTLALTATAGASLQSQINSLTVASNTKLAGSLNCATGKVDSVTTDGLAAGFVVGNNPPNPAAGNANYYLIVTVGSASYSPPGGGGPYAPQNGDWFLSNGTTWQYLGVGSRPAYASTTTAGIVQLATNADTQTGVNSTLAVTPAGLQSKVSDSTSTVSSTTIASSTAVKSAYDLGNAALPKAGGTMTGDLTFSGAGVGVVFNDASTVEAISDSTSTTSSVTAASSTAVKSAYDLGFAALPKAGGTMTGAITFVAGQVFPVSGIQDATTGQKGVVQIGTNIDVSSGTISVKTATTAQLGLVQVGTNIDVASGTISVKSATTGQAGIVQLNNTTSSTSTTQALTANQGYQLQQQINALSVSNNLTFAGTIDGSTGLMLTVTTEGAALVPPFAVGSPMPAAAAGNAEYFTIVTVPGTMTPPGGVSQVVKDGDWWLSNGTSYTYLEIGYSAPYASTTSCGVVQLATNAQTQAGVNTTAVVVPSALQSKMSDSTSTTSSTTIASSTAVKSAYDLANAAVPQSCYTALGALVTGTGAGTIGTLSVGSNGQFLAANSACSTGVQWCTISLACIPCSAFTASGQLLAGTGTSTFTALNVGSNGQFLIANSACTGGLQWVTECFVNDATYTAKGDIVSGTGAGTYSALPVGTNGQFLVANSACSTGLQWTTECFVNDACYNALGTLLAGSGVGTFSALPVGTNGQFLVVDTTCTTGLKWATECFVNDSTFTAKGDLIAGTGVGTYGNLPIGTNGQVLVPNSSCATGLEWITVGALCIQGYTCTATPFNSAFGALAGDSITSGVSNTAIGYNAGTNITSGFYNVAVGVCAGRGITTTDGNVAVGYETLMGAITGAGLVAVGNCALRAVTTGLNNIGIGNCAGVLITTGGCNIAIGSGALDSVTTSANNIAIGFNALTSITTGSENLAIGTQSGLSVTTGASNTYVGYQNGYFSTTATDNTTLGNCAGQSLVGGSFNVFIGSLAGAGVASGSCSVAIGYDALNTAYTGTQTIAIGRSAGTNLTSGACNTLVGHNAGFALTTGVNTALGWCALAAATTTACNTAVGLGALQSGAAPASATAVGHTAAQNTTGTGTTAMGRAALQNNTTGVNTAIGYFALQQHITATNSTAVGFQAGCAATGGGHTLIGNNAGNAITTGTNNTIVGPYVGTTTLTNNVVLADGSANIRFQANSSGAISFDGTNFGTAGQTLQSNGSAAVPTWVNPNLQALTTLTLTSTTPTSLLSVSAATFRAVFIDISVSDSTGAKFHTDTWQIVHDGTTTNVQNISGARIGTSPYSLSAAITAGNLVVSVTSTTTNSTKYVGYYQTFAI